MNKSSDESEQSQIMEYLGRFKVLKIHDFDKLILLLAKILSQLKNKQMNFPLKMIVIDSLSSLFWESGSKSIKQHEKY